MWDELRSGETDEDIIGALRREILKQPEPQRIKTAEEWEEELAKEIEARMEAETTREFRPLVPYCVVPNCAVCSRHKRRRTPRTWFKPFYLTWRRVFG